MIEFDWDESKASANVRKHGVTFAEGATVFGDPFARLITWQQVGRETRQVMIGLSSAGRLLVVVFVERGRVRLISTRRATPFERHAYEEASR